MGVDVYMCIWIAISFIIKVTVKTLPDIKRIIKKL